MFKILNSLHLYLSVVVLVAKVRFISIVKLWFMAMMYMVLVFITHYQSFFACPVGPSLGLPVILYQKNKIT